jgi:hypothetical protein
MQQTTVFRNNGNTFVRQPTSSEATGTGLCATPSVRNNTDTYIRQPKDPKTTGTPSHSRQQVQKQRQHLRKQLGQVYAPLQVSETTETLTFANLKIQKQLGHLRTAGNRFRNNGNTFVRNWDMLMRHSQGQTHPRHLHSTT